MAEMKIEYRVGKDGHYLYKRNPILESFIKVNSNPQLDEFQEALEKIEKKSDDPEVKKLLLDLKERISEEIKESLRFIGKMIPGPTFRSWLAFCRDVDQKQRGSEAGLCLFYHPGKEDWGAYPPKQKLSSVSVNFDGVSEAIKLFRDQNGKEWLHAGTLHSHPGPAEPSGIDINDEKKMDGIHIIVPDFGHKGDSGVTITGVSSEQRWRFKASNAVIDFSIKGEDSYPSEWMKQIEVASSVRTGGGTVYSRPFSRVSRVYGTPGGAVEDKDTWLSKKVVKDIRDVSQVLKFIGLSSKNVKRARRKIGGGVEDLCLALDWIRDAFDEMKGWKSAPSFRDVESIQDYVRYAGSAILEGLTGISDWVVNRTEKSDYSYNSDYSKNRPTIVSNFQSEEEPHEGDLKRIREPWFSEDGMGSGNDLMMP